MTSARNGFFLTFEGPDGSGKTTQLRRVAEWFRDRGVVPLLLRQPGGTPLGEQIRGMLLNSRSEQAVGAIAPLAELALMFADRAQQIQQCILPALREGRVVICDRYTDSSEAYQGAGRQLGTERVLAVHRAICDGLQPHLTILLLPDVDRALARARHRNEHQRRGDGKADENRFETEDESFFRRVHSAYAEIGRRESQRVATLTGDGSIESVAEAVREIVAVRWRRQYDAVDPPVPPI